MTEWQNGLASLLGNAAPLPVGKTRVVSPVQDGERRATRAELRKQQQAAVAFREQLVLEELQRRGGQLPSSSLRTLNIRGVRGTVLRDTLTRLRMKGQVRLVTPAPYWEIAK